MNKNMSKSFQELESDLELTEAFLKPILARYFEMRVQTKETHLHIVSSLTNTLMNYKHKFQEVNNVLNNEMGDSKLSVKLDGIMKNHCERLQALREKLMHNDLEETVTSFE